MCTAASRAAATAASLALAWCLAGCASPHPSNPAVDWMAGKRPVLGRAHSLFVDGAVAVSEEGGEPKVSDLRSELEELVRRDPRFELAESRDRADLVLYFEQRDRLGPLGVGESLGRWHWWGFVWGREGEEVASLHGEVEKGRASPALSFVRALSQLARRGRTGNRSSAAP